MIRLFLFILKASVTICSNVFPDISSCTVYSITNFTCLYLKIVGSLNLVCKTIMFEPTSPVQQDDKYHLWH